MEMAELAYRSVYNLSIESADFGIRKAMAQFYKHLFNLQLHAFTLQILFPNTCYAATMLTNIKRAGSSMPIVYGMKC